nr:MAG TPA: integrase [Caudoviricetes sp.]
MYYQPKIDFKPEEVIDYLRKSQSDDPLLTVEEVLSKHEAILDEWAEKNLGGVVPEENKFREVVSGETISGRPEIQKVLRLIESPKYKAVKVVEPQRLTRGDLEDIGRLMKLLKHTNTLVITPQRIYDLRDEYDWDAFERELKRGNDYLEYTKKILNRGRLLSVSQGNYVGNTAPYGYDKTFVTEGKRKCPILVPNKEEAEVVRMMFDLYVNKDMGCQSICNQFDKMGIKPPKGEHWSASAMSKMLENIHYIGKVKWNHRKTLTIVEEGEFKKTRPVAKIGEYLIYDGKHEAIVPEELFNAAQAKKGRNTRQKPHTKIRNPLAGLLFCQCGRAMSLRTYTKNGVERSAPRLLCDGQSICKTTSCNYDEIIEKVKDTLRQCIYDFEVRIKNDDGNSVKLHANLIKRLKTKKEELDKKEIAQWEAQADPDPSKRMPDHVFKVLNEKLLKEKEEVQQALCNAYESMPDPVDYEEKLMRFKAALNALENPDATAEQKNKLLKACIERITYKREKAERIKSKQVRYYDPVMKKTRNKSPLHTGGNWTAPEIELDVKLKIE